MNESKYNIELSREASSSVKRFVYKKYIIFAIILIICILISFVIITRNIKYNAALTKLENGEYELAYTMLKELGSSKAYNRIMESKYERATKLLKNDDEIGALLLFNEILDYKDSEEIKNKIVKDKEYLNILISKEGYEVVYGKYEQDNDISNGKENLEWIVIYNTNKKIYLVSKNIIDAKQYNTANGDGSSLKKWLIDEFINSTFTEQESELISHVGLLNKDDMLNYNKIIGTKPTWTSYAMAQKPSKGYYAGYSWWLTGEYFHGYAMTDVYMYVVIESGAYSNNVDAVTNKNGVRPAIIIDLNDNDIDYYLDDYIDIENAGIITRTKSDVNKEITNILGGSSSNSSSNGKICYRCDGTGKVTKHYGKSWNQEEGYKYGEKCGACGGIGYIK